MCQLAGISQSGCYRHWQPRQKETGPRDAIQCLALKHRHYGCQRIGAFLRREGWQANHKRLPRLMREDTFCTYARPVCANDDELASQLARPCRLVSDQLFALGALDTQRYCDR